MPLILFFIFFNFTVWAKDFGIVGDVYPIQENDFLEFIQNKLATLAQTGELKKMQQQMIVATRQHVDRPSPVYGITRAVANRHWQFDPTFIVTHDLSDHAGHVFARTGEKYNPLQKFPWRHVWIFYDADDSQQVEWVGQENRRLNGKDKLILVNGSVFTQMKLFKKRIYFDQYGIFTTKLGILHVPAEVWPQGDTLEIKEIKL